MAKVFVSYARDGAKIVKRIIRELTDVGFDFWMDTRNLLSGDEWPEEITNAIEDCGKFLLLMSVASMASDNIQREVQIAYEAGKKIIILRLDDAKIPPSLKYQLARIQWTEYSSPDWKTRIAMALRSRAKPTLHPKVKTIKSSPSNKTRMKNAPTAQNITAELVDIFSTSGVYYKDQCTSILKRVDELHNVIANHRINTSIEYQELLPKIHLLERIATISDLIKEFQSTCPPGTQDKRHTIHKELKSFLDDLNHEMKA